MTLTSLKLKIKGSVLIIFLIVYGVSFFAVGRLTSPDSSNNVKGVNSDNFAHDPIEKPQPYADVQKPEVISSSVKTCSNATFGFEISYPKDWFTTQNNEPQKCRYFAPFSFVVPQLTDTDFVPVKVEIIKTEDWQSTLSVYSEPNEFQNIDTVQNIEISGKPVTVVGSISTGKNLITNGYYKQSYLISDAKIPLIISYTQLNSNDDIENYKKNLKYMAESIKYF